MGMREGQVRERERVREQQKTNKNLVRLTHPSLFFSPLSHYKTRLEYTTILTGI